MDKQYDIIVIGAGNGGLSAAASACKRGFRTLLIEQHNLPGGFATSFRRGRFEFEPALHELCDVGEPASREEVGEKGVVRDRAVHERVLTDITDFIPSLGWRVAGLDFSPILGPEGNMEFLMYLLPSDISTNKLREYSVDVTIRRAYDNLFKSFQEGL